MIEMCSHYTTTGYPNFKPRCEVGLRASLKCHSVRKDCPYYTTHESGKEVRTRLSK